MYKTPLLNKLDEAIELLYIHAMLTGQERQRARQRLEKMVARVGTVDPSLELPGLLDDDGDAEAETDG